MLAITREFNYSESTFVLPPGTVLCAYWRSVTLASMASADAADPTFRAQLDAIVREGAERAGAVAERTLADVYERVGFVKAAR